MPIRDDAKRLLTETYPTHYTARTFFSDMDVLKHINNVAMARFFEEGRVSLDFTLMSADIEQNSSSSANAMLASLTIEYIAQAYYPGELEVRSGVGKIGRTSVGISQAAFQNGKCVALSDAILVKLSGGKPAPLSEDDLVQLKPLVLKA